MPSVFLHLSHIVFCLFDCLNCVVLLYCNFFVFLSKNNIILFCFTFYFLLFYYTSAFHTTALRARSSFTSKSFACKFFSAFFFVCSFICIYICVCCIVPLVRTISNDPLVCYAIFFIYGWDSGPPLTEYFCALYVSHTVKWCFLGKCCDDAGYFEFLFNHFHVYFIQSSRWHNKYIIFTYRTLYEHFNVFLYFIVSEHGSVFENILVVSMKIWQSFFLCIAYKLYAFAASYSF